MRTGWQRRKVADLESRGVLRVEDGNHGEYRPRPNEFGSDGSAFIRAADIANSQIDFIGASKISTAALSRIRKGVGAPGDVILSHKGTVGRVALAAQDAPPFVCSPQTTFWRVLDSDRIDRYFLYSYLRSPAFRLQLAARQNESDMAAYVSLTEQRKLWVDLPALREQRAIGAVLRALDDKIASNGRLDDCAQQLIAAEYAHATTGRPEAPLCSALGVEMGSPFAGEYFNQETQGRPLIRIRDLTAFEPQLWTTEARPDEKVAAPGDVLVGMDVVFSSTFWRGGAGVLNQRVCRFVPKHGVSRAFALLAIRPDLEFFERAKSGTTVIHLNKADIDRFRVPLLTAQEHVGFAQATEPLVDLVVQTSAESQTLIELRDTLLPELLSGRLRIAEAEEMVESVT
jgi:type I restriction enzyme, S subunit